MKLLVLAQPPPPLHGQSLMVQTLIAGLPAQGIPVQHVNLGLSRNAADIGRWRWGKVAAVFAGCFHAVAARFQHGCDTLYYVPAPGKRGALYRDWVVMLLCRPFFRKLVLHWHAAGLGEWLATHATAPERWLTNLLLGRADLAIVLGEGLRTDALRLGPEKISVVRNGIADPCPGFVRPVRPAGATFTAVFLGLGVPEKGVLDAIEAVRQVNALPEAAHWRLIVAGDFPDPVFAQKVVVLARESGGAVQSVGFVASVAKHHLLSDADALVFPTYYPAESQGLVVAEALAYDLPVIVSDWRAVAENLPSATTEIVPARAPAGIAAALVKVSRGDPPRGASRQHFLDHYTDRTFLDRMAVEIRSV